MVFSFVFAWIGAMFVTVATLDPKDVVLIVSSQSNAHHISLFNEFQRDVFLQANDLGKNPPIIHATHADFANISGAWTLHPLFPQLVKLHSHNASWFVFVEERTNLRLERLLNLLHKYAAKDEIWLGRALRDRQPTIIHHFALPENDGKQMPFSYPRTASGFAVSATLLKKLELRLKKYSSHTDFSIDHAYELALFVWNEGKGVALTHEPAFCVLDDDTNCATFSTPFRACPSKLTEANIFFAVKTCHKFHRDRVDIVKETWGAETTRIAFFSDQEDPQIPTYDLGIPNTERGHCGKTLAIIRHVAAKMATEMADIDWLVVSDDDTIFGVKQLKDLLTCYDPSEMLAIGERYGYNLFDAETGYDYITGGGGMVFSKLLVRQLADPEVCACRTISSPDDMLLGICLTKLGVPVTHSPFFHQARPVDYDPEYLAGQFVVSFHKHWMIDPVAVYKKWFFQVDLQSDRDVTHVEL